MKKVISITIGGVVFAIEEDAYTTLSSYLEAIKKNLSQNADYTEVADDIEIAIAEKFIARKCNEKKAVSSIDVESVTLEMGDPTHFIDEGDVQESEEVKKEAHTAPVTQKRLYRDTDNALLGGVASGIAQYFDIDPVIVRVLFLIAIFINGFGVLAYIILWLIVPEAKTTLQKYEMRGEKVTLKEITEQVKKNLESIQNSNYEPVKGVWARIRNILVAFFNILGRIMRFVISLLRYVCGLVLIFTGAVGLAGTVSVFSIAIFSETIHMAEEIHIVLEVLSSSALGLITVASLCIALVIPMLVLILAGTSTLARKNHFTLTKTTTLAVVWFVAVTLSASTLALQSEQIVHELESHGYNQEGYYIEVDVGPLGVTFTSTAIESEK